MQQKIIIPGTPIPKHRPRFTKRSKHAYSDQADECRQISYIVRSQIDIGSIILAPVTVSMLFKFKRPRSHYRTGKYSNLLKASAPQEHIVTPDATNLCKLYEDIFNGIVWKDDSQVNKLVAEKIYSETAETVIWIEWWDSTCSKYLTKTESEAVK